MGVAERCVTPADGRVFGELMTMCALFLPRRFGMALERHLYFVHMPSTALKWLDVALNLLATRVPTLQPPPVLPRYPVQQKDWFHATWFLIHFGAASRLTKEHMFVFLHSISDAMPHEESRTMLKNYMLMYQLPCLAAQMFDWTYYLHHQVNCVLSKESPVLHQAKQVYTAAIPYITQQEVEAQPPYLWRKDVPDRRVLRFKLLPTGGGGRTRPTRVLRFLKKPPNA